jgi:hypothetical protein
VCTFKGLFLNHFRNISNTRAFFIMAYPIAGIKEHGAKAGNLVRNWEQEPPTSFSNILQSNSYISVQGLDYLAC